MLHAPHAQAPQAWAFLVQAPGSWALALGGLPLVGGLGGGGGAVDRPGGLLSRDSRGGCCRGSPLVQWTSPGG